MKEKKLKKCLVLQQGQSDCGVACLLSLIKYYGGTESLEKLRELSGTNKLGTTLLGLFQAANNLGFDAEGFQADVPSLIEHGSPIILHVIIDNRLNHYVIYFGYEKGKFIIGDPAKGIVYYDEEQLLKIWVEKKCLTLKTNSQFKKETSAKKLKNKFLFHLIKEDYPLLGMSLFLGLGISILGMSMAIFSQKLIDDLLPSNDANKLIVGIVLIGLILFIRIGFVALREFLLLKQSQNFNNRIIHSFYKSLLHLPKSFFDSRKTGELVARLNDTGRIQGVVNQIAGSIVIDGLVVLCSLAFLYYYSWQSGLIATISLPIYFGLLYHFNTKIISAQRDLMAAYAHSEGYYINTLQGVASIKNFNRQSIFSKINQTIYGFFQDKIVALGKINIRLSFISAAASVVFLSGILLLTSFQVYSNTLTVGDLMAIIGIASNLLPSIASIALITIPLNEAKIAFDRMYEFVGITPENTASDTTPDIQFSSLYIKNISFRFPGRKKILNDISIKIKKNEIIALVGESGSGKSTFAQILQLFYKVESGSIRVNDEIDLSEIDTNSWRNIIGVVPQDIHLFNGTVLDNICLGDSKNKSEDVMLFCKEYGFEYYIQDLPQGYMTIVGEEGVNLSGGQKQIIALARTLYHKPQLLLLDEPTSALDKKTEEFVLNLLLQLKEKLGILFITHRLNTLNKISDCIYVIANGKIQDKGTHKQLLKSANLYSDYWSEMIIK